MTHLFNGKPLPGLKLSQYMEAFIHDKQAAYLYREGWMNGETGFSI